MSIIVKLFADKLRDKVPNHAFLDTILLKEMVALNPGKTFNKASPAFGFIAQKLRLL